MNKIYILENGTQLVSEQLNGKIYKEMNVDNTATLYYTDYKSDLTSKVDSKRIKAFESLQRIKEAESDKEYMTNLFDSLSNKNDILYTPHFYNYIGRVLVSANNKILRYRHETLAFDELADIRQFFLLDIHNQMIEIGDDKVLLDFNLFDNMRHLTIILHKIATREINKRMHKLFRDISIDEEINTIMTSDDNIQLLDTLAVQQHNDEAQYINYEQSVENLMTLIKEVATPQQIRNLKVLIAKQQYEQSTTYEERQLLTEEQKLMTYKVRNSESLAYQRMMKRVRNHLQQ